MVLLVSLRLVTRPRRNGHIVISLRRIKHLCTRFRTLGNSATGYYVHNRVRLIGVAHSHLALSVHRLRNQLIDLAASVLKRTVKVICKVERSNRLLRLDALKSHA